MAIHIWDIMDITKIGEKQYNSFVNERFVERSKPVTQPLKKNSLPTFTSTNKKTVSKDKTKVEVLKDDCASFLRLYIACPIRDGNVEDFFKYENQPWPPSLSQLSQLRGGQKVDLALCLLSSSAEIATQPVTGVVILDGTAVVQMLHPRTVHTFDEYLSIVYAPYILMHLEMARRVHLVWDVYQDDSLKRSLREKRGSGQRRNTTINKNSR